MYIVLSVLFLPADVICIGNKQKTNKTIQKKNTQRKQLCFVGSDAVSLFSLADKRKIQERNKENNCQCEQKSITLNEFFFSWLASSGSNGLLFVFNVYFLSFGDNNKLGNILL